MDMVIQVQILYAFQIELITLGKYVSILPLAMSK